MLWLRRCYIDRSSICQRAGNCQATNADVTESRQFDAMGLIKAPVTALATWENYLLTGEFWPINVQFVPYFTVLLYPECQEDVVLVWKKLAFWRKWSRFQYTISPSILAWIWYSVTKWLWYIEYTAVWELHTERMQSRKSIFLLCCHDWKMHWFRASHLNGISQWNLWGVGCRRKNNYELRIIPRLNIISALLVNYYTNPVLGCAIRVM